MTEEAHIAPRIADLARLTLQAGPETTVQEVVEFFRSHLSLSSLPIIEAGRLVSLVQRKVLFHHLSRPFSMDLYARKSITTFLAEMPGDGVALTLSPELDIHEALAELLTADPGLDMDSFAVAEDGRCVGVVTVPELMMAISTDQKRLLEILDLLSARIRKEVDKARSIQLDLLPEPEFSFRGIKVGGMMRSSTEIGGDLFDYFTVGDSFLGLVVGDVSGHGVQSGMVATAAKASLHSLISTGVVTPSELLNGMNAAILATAKGNLLMTCSIAMIDIPGRRIRVANAGHPFPFLCSLSGRSSVMIEGGGLPLGFEHDNYEETETPFNEGDTLLLYSDGITEHAAESGEEFGYTRLGDLLARKLSLSPYDLCLRILNEAHRFGGGSPFADDVTLLAASFTGETR